MSLFQHIVSWSLLALVSNIIPIPGSTMFYLVILTPCYLVFMAITRLLRWSKYKRQPWLATMEDD